MYNSFETWAEIFGEVIGRSFVQGIREGLVASGFLERMVQARRQEAARALEESRLQARREAEEAARARAASSTSSSPGLPSKRGPRLEGAGRLGSGGVVAAPPRRRGRRRKVDIDVPPPEPLKPVQARPPLIRRRGVLVSGATSAPVSEDPSTADSAEAASALAEQQLAERSTEQIFQALVQAANSTPPNGTSPKSGAAGYTGDHPQ